MKYKHRRLILTWNPARFLLDWMRRIHFKKWDNVSLYKIIRLLIRNLREDEIVERANGVAYNFILAIFPAVIFLFTLIPYVSRFVPQVNSESIM